MQIMCDMYALSPVLDWACTDCSCRCLLPPCAALLLRVHVNIWASGGSSICLLRTCHLTPLACCPQGCYEDTGEVKVRMCVMYCVFAMLISCMYNVDTYMLRGLYLMNVINGHLYYNVMNIIQLRESLYMYCT